MLTISICDSISEDLKYDIPTQNMQICKLCRISTLYKLCKIWHFHKNSGGHDGTKIYHKTCDSWQTTLIMYIFVLNITCQQLGNLCQFYSYMVLYIFCKQFRDAISCICVILYLHSLYLCIWDLGTSIWIYLKQDM